MKRALIIAALMVVAFSAPAHAQTAICNQGSNGQIACRPLVPSRDLEQNQAIVHSMMPKS